MKSVTVEGCFSRQHCSKRHNCRFGSTKPALLFKGNSKSNAGATSGHFSFSSLLEKEGCKVDLGPVDKQWFENAFHDGIGAEEGQLKRNNRHEVEFPSPAVTETPLRGQRSSEKQQSMTPQLFNSPTSPFTTPEECHPVTQQTAWQLSGAQLATDTSPHAYGDAGTPSLPSLVPMTPNVPAKDYDSAKHTPAQPGTTPSPGGRQTQDEPSPGGWFPPQKQITPTFMKQLFKTPSTVSKLDDSSFTTPGQFLSTPLRMSVSLGADLDESNLSWTSSLATPQETPHRKIENTADLHQESTCIVKALFTSASETPVCHTPQQRPTDTDSQSTNLHLQSLHMSSTEEDTLDDTIRSDVADDCGIDKEGRNMQEVVGIQVEENIKDADEELQGDHGEVKDETDCPGLSNIISMHVAPGTQEIFTPENVLYKKMKEKNYKSGVGKDTTCGGTQQEDLNEEDQVQRTPILVQQRRGDGSCDSHCPALKNEAQDDQDVAVQDVNIRQRITEDAVVCASNELHSSSISEVHGGGPGDNPKNNAEVHTSSESKGAIYNTRTASQRSVENLTPDASCVHETSNLSSFDQSRMEDTLACFILTPPQTRSRLAQLKKQKLEKDKAGASIVIQSSAISDSTSSEPCSISETAEQTLERQELRSTKTGISVISVRDEDGSLKESVEHFSDIQQSQLTNSNFGTDLPSLNSEVDRGTVKSCDFQNQEVRDKSEVDRQRARDLSPTSTHLIDIQGKNGVSSPPVVQEHCIITPVRQGLPDSSDIFSQISPNYEEALCQITDEVSESHRVQSGLASLTSKDGELTFPHQLKTHSEEPSCDRTMNPFKTPSVNLPSIKSILPDPMNQNPPSTITSEENTDRPAPFPVTKTQDPMNKPKISTQLESPSQVFRKQPKASTRKFFYPSMGTSATKTTGPKAMQWLSQAVLAKAPESEQQEEPTTENKPKPETKMTNVDETRNKASRSASSGRIIYSSTPAPRNSAFVTFTNFIKSEKTAAVATDDTKDPSLRKVTPSVASHNKTTHMNTACPNSQSNITVGFNQTTPVSSKTALPRSNATHSGIRGRSYTCLLPAPKRLKMAINEDPKIDVPSDKKAILEADLTKTLEEVMEGIPTGVSRNNALAVESSDGGTLGGNSSTHHHATVPDLNHRCEDGVAVNSDPAPALKRCSKPNIAKQKETTCMQSLCSKQEKQADFNIPMAVSFASASGKPINISERAMETAKQRWFEDQSEDIPDSVCFTSRTTKVCEKDNSYGETGRNSVPVNVTFAAASGKAIQISKSALQKAKMSFLEDEIHVREGSSTDETKSVPVSHLSETVSLSSMKSKTIRPSKLNMRGKHQAATGASVEATSTFQVNPDNSESIDGFMNQSSGVDETHVPPDAVSSVSDNGNAANLISEDYPQTKGVPSFAGFASASGKAIAISESAMQKAKKLFEEEDDQIPTSVNFATAAGKAIAISKADLKKASSLLDEPEDDDLPSTKGTDPSLHSLQDEAKKRSSIVSSRQSRLQQPCPKPQVMLRNLPKGFRPFKAPSKLHPPAQPAKNPGNAIASVEPPRTSLQVEAEGDDKTPQTKTVFNGLKTIPKTNVVLPPSQVPMPAISESLEFEDFLSASQAQREIEAAEEMESAYAFMQAEDDSFSHFEDPIINTNSNVTSNAASPPSNEDKVIASQDCEKFIQLEFTASEINTNKSVGVEPTVHAQSSSQVSSKASDTLDRAFVESQSSVTKEAEIDEQLPKDHREEEFDEFGNESTLHDVDITSVRSETAASTVSQKSSQEVVDAPPFGFQIIRNKSHMQDEMLQQGKMPIPAKTDSPVSITGDFADQDRTYPCEQEKDFKSKNLHTFSGFQTAGGKQVKISEEALKKAKRLFVEEEKCHPCQGLEANVDLDPNARRHQVAKETVSDINSFSVGFQTASGGKVTICEESLKRAKLIFEEAEEKFNKPSSVVPSSTKTAADGIRNRQKDSFSIGKTSLDDTSMNFPSGEGRYTVPRNEGIPFSGFSTASGNKVSISKAALDKAKEFLREEDEETPLPQRKQKRLDGAPNVATATLGFQTARGSAVTVSHESLEAAKRTLDDSTEHSNITPKCPVGFQTASGNRVTVSAESLAKAQQFLAEEETDTRQRPAVDHGRLLQGFSTASGNQITISQGTLEKARRLFEEPEDDDTSRMPITFNEGNPDNDNQKNRLGTAPIVPVPHQGFQTASGSSVSVSKTSLQQVRTLLANADQEGSHQPDPATSLSSTPAPAKTQSVPSIGPKTSTTAAQQFGGDGSDAVVPQLTGKTSHNGRAVTGVTHDGQRSLKRMSFQQEEWSHPRFAAPFTKQRNVPPKVSPSPFRPPYQTGHQQTRTSGCQSGKPREASQVVPQTPIPPLPPKSGSFSSEDNGQTVDVRPNKRCLDFSIMPCSDGPVAKKCKVDDAVLGNSMESVLKQKTNNVLCDKEQERDLPLGVWERARRNQASRIQSKKKQVIKPDPGDLFKKRNQEPRLPLYELVNGQPPMQSTRTELVEEGVPASVLTVTSSSAKNFKFILSDHFSPETLEDSKGLLLADGGMLIPDDLGSAGKQEFLNALLDTPGVDPKYVTSDWLNNHYRWIVWKLAAMETAYPQHLAARYMTPDQVLLRLKYRYDREIDHTHRSALKKILERDDAPSKRMVLCVAGIHHPDIDAVSNQEGTSDKNKEKILQPAVPALELTDGWYAIRTVIDKPLAGLVNAGKIFTGQKLCIYGAELVGSQDACSPLEVPASLCLKISANGTRRARYDARLGLQRHPQPFPLSLASLYPDGGTVGCVDVVVVRSYPMQFMEKQNEGGCIFRGRRAEEKEAGRFAQEHQKKMEKLYSKIQDEYQEKENLKVTSGRRSSSVQKLTSKQVSSLNTGQEVYEAISNALDPGDMQSMLSERQIHLLNDYQRSLHDKKQSDLQVQINQAMEDSKQDSHIQRNVTPILRLRITDYLSKADTETYQLTIWRPTDDIMQLLTEGKRFKIFNIGTSSGRFCLGSSRIQLSSTRATRYHAMTVFIPPDSAFYHPREVLRFTQAHHPGFKPAYGEVDVVGVVIMIQGTANSPGKSNSQMVYLSDSQSIVIAVKFWCGLQVQCLEGLVKPGALLTVSNLQWRANSSSSSIPCLHVSDATSVTQSPKADHLRAALQDMQNHIQNPKKFAESLEQAVAEMIASRAKCLTPVTPKSDRGPVTVTAPWSGHRPIASSTRSSMSFEQTNLSNAGRGGMITPVRTPGLPNKHQHLYSPALNSEQLRPSAASTPVPVTPRAGPHPASTKGPIASASTPVSDTYQRRRLDASRRYDLLSRVPSPPPLSPLPTPVSSRMTRGFRLPSFRRSIPHRGSSGHGTPGMNGQESPYTMHFNQHSRGPSSKDVNPSVQGRKGEPPSPDVEDLGSTLHVTGSGGDYSPEEEMTASQRQVQEVLGMSYKSLGEIDWEWTQQMDPPSPPDAGSVIAQSPQQSQDFSYGTPTQSPLAKEEQLCAPVETITKETKQNVRHLDKNVSVLSKDAQGSSQGDKASGGRKHLGRSSRRKKVGIHHTATIQISSESLKSSQSQESRSGECVSPADGGGDHLKKDYQSSESEVKGSEFTANEDIYPKTNNSKVPVEEINTRPQETAAGADKTCATNETVSEVTVRQVRKVAGEQASEVQPAQVSNATSLTGRKAATQAPVQKRKRLSRSRADLSILEHSNLLVDGSGEPTKRMTRSASKRSTAGQMT